MRCGCVNWVYDKHKEGDHLGEVEAGVWLPAEKRVLDLKTGWIQPTTLGASNCVGIGRSTTSGPNKVHCVSALGLLTFKFIITVYMW